MTVDGGRGTESKPLTRDPTRPGSDAGRVMTGGQCPGVQDGQGAGRNHTSRIRILRIFSFLKFNEFYEFFPLKKIRKKSRNFANHRCLTCFDVLECNVHL